MSTDLAGWAGATIAAPRPIPHETNAYVDLQSLLRCPVDLEPLHWSRDGAFLASKDAARRYPVVDGIPCLFAPNEWPEGRADVTDTVKAFYEQTPFPNYDDVDNRDRLRAKARYGVFARLLDHQIPRQATVLEVGCGTGQLSNFLGMAWGRTVVGADLCLNSLRLAKSFRDRCSIANAHFVQINLFRPPFADESFDVVICNGVLHHTSHPKAGFLSIARKLKPGGFIIIGLYNWLGRLPTLWRRALIERFGERWAKLDPRLRSNALNKGRWSAWFMDQYRHPHESRHSIGEVTGWFSESGIDAGLTIPPVAGEEFSEETELFRPRPPSTRMDRLTAELEMLLKGGTDGGLFMVIGRRRQA